MMGNLYTYLGIGEKYGVIWSTDLQWDAFILDNIFIIHIKEKVGIVAYEEVK